MFRVQEIQVTLKPGSDFLGFQRDMLRNNMPYIEDTGKKIVRIMQTAYAPHRFTGKLNKAFSYKIVQESNYLLMRVGIIQDNTYETKRSRRISDYVMALEYGSRSPVEIHGPGFSYTKRQKERIGAWANARGIPPNVAINSIRLKGTKAANKFPIIREQSLELLKKNQWRSPARRPMSRSGL